MTQRTVVEQHAGALYNALLWLMAHHRITELDGVSDTLQPRLDECKRVLRLIKKEAK